MKIRKLTTILAALISGTALSSVHADNAFISTNKTVFQNADDSLDLNIRFDREIRGDLYVIIRVADTLMYMTQNGLDLAPSPYFSGDLSGDIPVFEGLSTFGVGGGLYPVYQLVTVPGGDPGFVGDWIGGLDGLSKINISINEDPLIHGDRDGDGYADDDLNQDGFHDDDRDQDGYHDDDRDRDGFHDDDRDQDGESDIDSGDGDDFDEFNDDNTGDDFDDSSDASTGDDSDDSSDDNAGDDSDDSSDASAGDDFDDSSDDNAGDDSDDSSDDNAGDDSDDSSDDNAGDESDDDRADDDAT